MADWSDLPTELLDKIQTHLNSPIDTLRFRAICSTWRKSTPSPQPSNGHMQFPFSLTSHNISIFKRQIFHFSPPQFTINESPENPNSWVIKLEQINPNFFHLFFPLSCTRITPLPANFPNTIDVSRIRIRELGREYFLRYTEEIGSKSDFLSWLMEKVAFLPANNGDDFFLLTIHISGKLALFNACVNSWEIISDDSDLPYDDVIAFNGCFYAVDYGGKTVLVDVNATFDGNVTNVVASAVCGGDQKRLVVMGGELLLVDVYMGLPPWDKTQKVEDSEEDDSGCWFQVYRLDRSVWFKVYRLDREAKCWVEVKDLGNNILFVGPTSSFSTSADDFAFHKGNCIYFSFPDTYHPSGFVEEEDAFKFYCGGVFDLEDSRIAHSKLFWPPPPWITSS